MPAPSPVRRRLAAGLAALVTSASLLLVNPSPAAAVVSPLHGFRATVDGFTSWYGSYGMGTLGTAWCIDHGSRAPDPAFAYAPTALGAVPADTRAAMAWVVGAHGRGTDRVAHAAVMLVLHDLMGARYPSGPLDLDRLTVRRMAGFGGHEAQVLERARWLKADGLAHGHLRGPLTLSLVASPPRERTTTLTVRLRDVGGHPLAGIRVQLDAPGAGARATSGTTGADGTWRTEALPAAPVTIRAVVEVPRLALDAWAPTTRSAQRVARPGRDVLRAAVTVAPPPTTTTAPPPPPPPPTTTTTTIAPTTTSTSTTTTTAAPTTTTLAPTTTALPAAAVPPSTTASTSTTAPPPTVVPAEPVSSLPRTGRDVTALVLLALGCVSIGSAALDVAAGRTRTRGHHPAPRHRR